MGTKGIEDRAKAARPPARRRWLPKTKAMPECLKKIKATTEKQPDLEAPKPQLQC